MGFQVSNPYNKKIVKSLQTRYKNSVLGALIISGSYS